MSFFAKIKNWIVSAFKKAPAMAVAISSAVNYCVPFIEQLDMLVLPELAPVVNPILDKIKVGLAALAVTVKDSSPAGVTNAKSILASITTNLDLLLPAMQIKNENSLKEAHGIVALLNGEIAAITADLHSAS